MLEDKDRTVQYLHHLATLYMEIDSGRVEYTFKKSQRKIISQIENFHFENDRFITESIKKPDKKKIEETLKEIPENLSTFKISLNENEKEARNNLVLPYLPKYY